MKQMLYIIDEELDWIEKVFGKRQSQEEIFIIEDIIKLVAQKTAENIDKQIMESFRVPEILLRESKNESTVTQALQRQHEIQFGFRIFN